MATKNAVLRALVENQVVELLVKSNVENIYLEDGTTLLSTKLAEILTTLGQKANSTDVTAEINAAIDALIGGAPDTYNTLKEIADYLTTHQDEYTALIETVAGKVDKVEGKGLSTNDFTDALLEKLTNIAAGAQVNVIEKITVNGAEQSVNNKTVNVVVPTGALASKDEVTSDDLSDELLEKVNASAEGNHSHLNKDELDKIASGDKDKWDAAAAKAHEHSNKTELDKIASGDKAKWDAAEQNAKDYADELNTAMDTRVKTVESKAHTHSNKTVLDGITSDDVAAWDAAEQNAKSYADTQIAAEKARAEAAEQANATAAANAQSAANKAQSEVDTLETTVAELAAKGNVYVSASQPADLKEGDLWIQLV